MLSTRSVLVAVLSMYLAVSRRTSCSRAGTPDSWSISVEQVEGGSPKIYLRVVLWALSRLFIAVFNAISRIGAAQRSTDWMSAL